jgi:hypothetical protein
MAWVSVVVLVIVGLSGCSAAARPATVATVKTETGPVLPRGTAAVEGYVVDASFGGLLGAIVVADGTPLTATTDAKGYFFLGPMTPSPVKLHASQPGFEAQARTLHLMEGKLELVVFVLTAVPLPTSYTVTQQQKGLIACNVAADPPASTSTPSDGIGSDVVVQCGTPTTTYLAHDTGRPKMVEAADRSQLAWTLDEPKASWVEGRILTSWMAGQELARILQTSWTVAGCTAADKTFGHAVGASPLKVAADPRQVSSVLAKAEGTTCGATGDRCDADACTVTSTTQAVAHAVGTETLRAGATFQQVFTQDLVATFGIEGMGVGQTLK